MAARRATQNAVESTRATARSILRRLPGGPGAPSDADGSCTGGRATTARTRLRRRDRRRSCSWRPGRSTSLIPERTRMMPNPTRSARSGTWIERCDPIRTPGIDRRAARPSRGLSTSPWSRCEIPATQSRTAAWNMSVPTIFWCRQRVGEEHREAEERPRPTEVSPTTNPPKAPIDRDRLVASRRDGTARRRCAT